GEYPQPRLRGRRMAERRGPRARRVWTGAEVVRARLDGSGARAGAGGAADARHDLRRVWQHHEEFQHHRGAAAGQVAHLAAGRRRPGDGAPGAGIHLPALIGAFGGSMMRRGVLTISLVLALVLTAAPIAVLAHPHNGEPILFGIAPQQEPEKVREMWRPFFSYLEQEVGYRFAFETASSIEEFQQRVLAGRYDHWRDNPPTD